MNRSRPLLLTLAAAGLAVALAGCGGAEIASSTPTPVEPTTGAASEPTLRAIETESADTVATVFAGGGDQETSIDPCALVTPDEVATLLGAVVVGEVARDPGFPLACVIPFTEFSARLTVGTSADWRLVGQDGSAASIYEGLRSSAEGALGYEEVPGLGEAAFTVTFSGVTVLQGDVLLQVSGVSNDQAVAIAQVMLARIEPVAGGPGSPIPVQPTQPPIAPVPTRPQPTIPIPPTTTPLG